MRIHLTITGFVLSFSFIYGLQAHEYAVLFFAIGFVIVTEMINTSIESVVNMKSHSYDQFAKVAKDIAAGAVLISSIISVCIGCVFFLHFPKLSDVLLKIITTPYLIIPYCIYAILGVLFIFIGFNLFTIKLNKKKYVQKDNPEQVTIYKIDKKG